MCIFMCMFILSSILLLGEKCYRARGWKASERVTWNKALERCRKYGGDLVSIQSQEEQGNDLVCLFIKKYINILFKETQYTKK